MKLNIFSNFWLGITSVTVALGLLPNARALAITLVDTELSLLVDVSGSINTSEFDLQRNGYAAAFRNNDVIDAISNGNNGSIAANLIYWSGSTSQVQAVGWTEINSADSANAFADLIAGTDRPFSGSTGVGSAIDFATPLFGTETGGADNGFESTRQIIDVSGDGISNTGSDTATARDAALSAGIDVINGLPIENFTGSTITDFYRDNVIGGDNPFVETADGFDDFERAIQQKVLAEVTPVPEPLTMLGSFLVLGGGIVLKRRQKKVSTAQAES